MTENKILDKNLFLWQINYTQHNLFKKYFWWLSKFSWKPFPTKWGLEDAQKRGQSANKVSFTACHNFGQAVAIAFASPVVNLTTCSPLKTFFQQDWLQVFCNLLEFPEKLLTCPLKTEFNSKIYKPRAGTQLSLQTLREARKLKKDARGERETERFMLRREQCLLDDQKRTETNGIFLRKQNLGVKYIVHSVCKNVPSFPPLFSLDPSV